MAKVTRQGDVSATPGTTPFTGANSGAWTAGTISETAYDKVVSGGANAISQAECTFNFSGANASGTAVTGSETVTLSAKSTKLQQGAAGVLVAGDSATGTFGNTLTASSGPKLGTA